MTVKGPEEKTYLITDSAGQRYLRSYDQRTRWDHKLECSMPYIRINWENNRSRALLLTESDLPKVTRDLAGKSYRLIPTNLLIAYQITNFFGGVTLQEHKVASLDHLPYGYSKTPEEAIAAARKSLEQTAENYRSNLAEMTARLAALDKFAADRAQLTLPLEKED